jgi:hypothetical protein
MMSSEQVAARAAQRVITAATPGAGEKDTTGVKGAGGAGVAARDKGALIEGGLSSHASAPLTQQQQNEGDDEELIIEEEDKENQCGGVAAGVVTSTTDQAAGQTSKQRLGSLSRTGPESDSKGKSSKNPFLRRLAAGSFHGATGTGGKKVRV